MVKKTGKIDLEKFKIECKRCGYKWVPRTNEIKRCPNPKCQHLKWYETVSESRINKRYLHIIEKKTIVGYNNTMN